MVTTEPLDAAQVPAHPCVVESATVADLLVSVLSVVVV